ncbi:MAG TPA: PaaI family thioesterase [Trueperaceae bacterium]|nr:PaaI family thioesterase [Trueperaceae bacterium]
MATSSDKRAGRDPAQRYLGTVADTLLETLGIVVTEVGPERVVATMPVTPAHHQPHGILHGGASVALAETVASIGASVELQDYQRAVGLEINANHLRQVTSGLVTAVATPIHRGRRTHVWAVEIREPTGKLVCVSRCTVAILGQDMKVGGPAAADPP